MVDELHQTDRPELLKKINTTSTYDMVIIGGGATGLGVALNAALRGLSVLLCERADFAKGTSSRSTKLLHGGVRYLAQGNISLVREALHERALILQNAPHLAQPLAFVMPSYACWEMPFFGTGLMMYDALAGRRGLGKTSFLGKDSTLRCLPNLKPANLRGGVKYWDGQFDDARLAIALARTAAQHGALLINYMPVTGLMQENGKISGIHCQDALSGANFTVRSRCVVNATGVWVDRVRQMASTPDSKETIKDVVSPSQGVHVVVDRSFMPGNHALIIPKTSDGRVLFAVPWLGKVILGTTDTPRHDTSEEPDAFKEELEFILNESARYLERAPSRDDIRSIWVGLRPLVKPNSDDGTATKKISREHTVMISGHGLVTVTGGKWTTYRAMAEDVMQHCQDAGLVTTQTKDQTEHAKLVGSQSDDQAVHDMTQPSGEHSYGDERHVLATLPGHDHMMAEGLTEAMVRFAARFEYAVHVEDVLARRSRLLFLDARQAQAVADEVGRVLKQETGLDPEVEAFQSLAKHYQQLPG